MSRTNRFFKHILLPVTMAGLLITPLLANALSGITDSASGAVNTESLSGSETTIASSGATTPLTASGNILPSNDSGNTDTLYAPTTPGVWEKVTTPIVNPTVAKIRVAAEPRGGTYFDQVIVVLYTSNPKAKIWYVTDPNASPGDAMPYTGGITLTKSTPILFFAYIDEQIESKIMREDYKIIPKPKETPVVTGTTVATATDVIKKPSSTKKPTSALAIVKPTKSVVNSGAISTGTTAPSMNSGTELAVVSSPKTPQIPARASPATYEPPSLSISDSLKTSTLETKSDLPVNPGLLAIIGISLLGAWVGARIYLSRRKKA